MPKYNSIDTIPAKVFFEIKETRNLQLLKPKPREKLLWKVFEDIEDEYFKRSDNPEAKRYLDLSTKIPYLNFKIAVLKKSLHFYYSEKTTKQMREDFANALKEGYDIILDLNKPFSDEVLRILNVEIGIIKNDLSEAEMELEALLSRSKAHSNFDYFKTVVDLSVALPNNSLLKEDMTLAVYVELLNKAKKITEAHEQEKQKNKMRR